MPVLLDGSVSIGNSGAVSSLAGPYIKSVTHMGTGLYQIQLQDNYNRFYGMNVQFDSPVSGAALDPHTGNIGQAYIITTLGNTNWSLAGVPAGVTPAVGVGFVLAADPGVGTGRVKAVGSSGIMRAEVIGNSNLSSAPVVANSGAQGAIILIQCLQAQIGAATTQGSALQYAPADPASGSVMRFSAYMSNSSVLIQGE